MSLIYQKTLDLFQAEEQSEQSRLYYEVQHLIQDALKTKQDNFLGVALAQAEKNKKAGIWQHIQKTITQSVDIYEYQKDGKEYISYLFLVPFVIMPGNQSLTLPAIEDMESWWRAKLAENYLIAPGGLEFNFAPVLLGKKAAAGMSMSDWFQIHKTNSSTLDKRHTRPMYSKPFQIHVQADKPHLSFFVATVNQEKNNNLGMPLLDLTDERTESLNQVIDEVSQLYNSHVADSTWLFMPIGRLTDVIGNAYDTYQDILTNTLIRAYSPYSDVEFALVPTANNTSFALIVWSKAKNLVVDSLILNQYVRQYNALVDMVMEYLYAQNIATLYVGNANMELEQFNNLGKIDFQHYLRKHGANILKAE